MDSFFDLRGPLVPPNFHTMILLRFLCLGWITVPIVVGFVSLDVTRPLKGSTSVPLTSTIPRHATEKINGDQFSSSPPSNSDNNNDFRNGYNIVNGYSMPHGQSSRYSDMLDEKRTWIGRMFTSRPAFLEEDEDGWGDMRRKKRSMWVHAVRSPLKKLRKLAYNQKVEPGTLILVRHGESTWNANKVS